MITQLDIMDAIAALTSEKLPVLKRVYTDLVPRDFKRPSLLMEAVTQSVFAVNCKTVRVDSFFTLTIYDETDDYSNCDTCRLLGWQQDILGLFRSGFLQVGDRALSVEASTGGRDWDKAFVDIQLTYYDDRDDTPDTTPLIENIETNMTLKG